MIKATAQPDVLLAWMACLADPMRLRLLRILEQQELGVEDMRLVVQAPQSTVSRHLKMLLEQGWVQSRRQGTNHIYEMILDELTPPARKLWLIAREQTETWATVKQDQLRLQRRLAERENDSQSFFAGAAGDWDKIRTELYGNGFDLQAILPLLPSEFVIADLGCGAGDLACKLAAHVKRVIGVDNSAEMLKAARKRGGQSSNLELRKGELTALPMEDGEADAALMILSLTYAAEPERAIAEMSRILKPGGRGIIVDLLRHDREDFRRQLGQRWPGFEMSMMAEQLAAVGFKQNRLTPLPPDQNAKGPALFIASGVKS